MGDFAPVDILVSYPRLDHKLRIASPKEAKYRAPKAVWDRVEQSECDKNIWWGVDPLEAVKGADVVVTDTWYAISFSLIVSNNDLISIKRFLVFHPSPPPVPIQTGNSCIVCLGSNKKSMTKLVFVSFSCLS
jgi:hypothetical protein